MLAACILLALAVGALAAWCWLREQSWRQRLRRLAEASGIPVPASTSAAALDAFTEHFRSLATERADLQKELYLRRLFESLLNEIRQGVLIVDPELRIRFANHTIAQLFRRPHFQRHRPLLEEIQDHQIVETVRDALARGRPCVRQIRFVPTARSSSSRHYLIEAAPLPAQAERGAWLMVHDITEQIVTEQIRKDFVANASHELRTPLTLILGYVETLQSDATLEDLDTSRHCLAVMERHGRRLLRIIEDMLTISRLEAAGASLTIEPFNVRACVQDAIDHLTPMLENRHVQFEFDFPADGGLLHGDRFYWDQIFTNLIENAIKENPDRPLTIRTSGRWQGEECTLTISDDGVGIASHDVPFVFKRFYRGHKHHAQTIKGTGLGLSIVRRAIEAHGGSIDLRSTPGQETVFTIRVPASLPLTPVEPITSRAEGPAPETDPAPSA